ncbi:MAG: class I SAM-dependent methyltransferase [Thaumarchaeota archaeon]|nr:class I SAM-dependent methyltransferase [Nitrososphaerota archaeon]
MTMEDSLLRYYKEHDDFLRYGIGDRARKRAISGLYEENREYFGKRILDIACGGGVLAHVLKGQDHQYIGVDKNPDIIQAAKSAGGKLGSQSIFILGDAKSANLEGVFDTVTLLGNALIHFNPSELSEILRHNKESTRVGSHFLAEYRDVVSMLFDRKWSRRFTDKLGRRVTTSLTRGIDAERGEIPIDSTRKGHDPLRFTHAVWSPFILESVMSGLSWSLVRRTRTKTSYVWLDVYRRNLSNTPRQD